MNLNWKMIFKGFFILGLIKRLFFVAISLGILYFSYTLYREKVQYIERAVTTVGSIVLLGDKGMIIEFSDQKGERYELKGDGSLSVFYNEGEKVKVYYVSENPKAARLGGLEMWYREGIITAIGIFLLFCSLPSRAESQEGAATWVHIDKVADAIDRASSKTDPEMSFAVSDHTSLLDTRESDSTGFSGFRTADLKPWMVIGLVVISICLLFKPFVTLGAASLSWAIILFRKTRVFIKSAEQTEGTFIGARREVSGGDTSSFPVIEFSDRQGNKHSFSSNIGSSGPFKDLGRRVRVLYRTDDPKAARINSIIGLYGVEIILLVIGLLLIRSGL